MKKKHTLSSSSRLSIFPPINAKAVLHGCGKQLAAEISWDKPRVNAENVAGYHLERSTWWPGQPTSTVILTAEPVEGCCFVDKNVKPDFINEYRIISVHKQSESIRSAPSFPCAIYGYAYLRYNEIVEEMKQLACDNSDICRLIDAGPGSGEGRRVWCMVLGKDNSDNPDRPGIFIHANAHAAENQCTDTAMGIIREAINGYRKGDPVFMDIFENIQARIIPMYNVFGRTMVEKGFPGQARKSHPVKLLPPPLDPLMIEKSWNFDGTPGIDPNRQFDVEWSAKLPGRTVQNWGKLPFTLPETRAVANMALALRPQISIDFHAPCGVPLYPSAWPDGTSTVDHNLFIEVAKNVTKRSSPTFPADNAEESHIPYQIVPGWGTGWFYKMFYGVPLCPEGFYEQMPRDPRLLAIGPSISLEELIPGNLDAFIWMAKRIRGAGITVYVKDPEGKPLVADVKVLDHMDTHCAPQLTDRKYGVYRRILIPDNYRISLYAEGYETHFLDIKIKAGKNKTINVVLNPT